MTNRKAIIRVGNWFLSDLLRSIPGSNIPKDLRVCAAQYDPMTENTDFLCESESFDEVLEGCHAERFETLIAVVERPVTQ